MRLSAFLVLCSLCCAAALASGRDPFPFGGVFFEENLGQTSSAVQYAARARGQQVYLTSQGVVLSTGSGPAITMRLAGAGPARWQPAGAQVGTISYFIASARVNGARQFDRVAWRNALPGIDLVLYGNDGDLEYDLVIAPGADPSRVRLQFTGAPVARRNDGSIAALGGGVRQRPPVIWQAGRKVPGSFEPTRKNGVFRLSLAAYDRTQRLVVDPVLESSTPIGGENDDEVVAVTDGAVVGNTRSLTFPAGESALRSTRDIFVRGTPETATQQPQNVFANVTIVGGSGDDEAVGIGFDLLNRTI